MAIIMADNFTINLEKSLDDRTYFKTKKAMKDFSINKTTVIGTNYIFPITSGSIGYCEETGKHYYFAGRKTDGTITMTVPDAKLEDMGYWKELKLGGGGGVEIVNNYSLLPTVTEDTICYCIEDYIDTIVTPNVTHEKGFYLYHNNGVSPAEWKLIGGQAKVELKKEIDNNYIEAVTINGTNENILCEKKIETIGSEVREILIAKAPSSDGSINVGDVVSIKKTINSVIIFEYNILDDNTIHDPFA